MVDQRRLPNSGLARHEHERAAAGRRALHRLLEHGSFT
jgi:hypothetical protein